MASDMLPQDPAAAVPGDVPAAEADEDFASDMDTAIPEDQDWTVQDHQHKLMRRLHDSITAHLEAGDFVPSVELETALAAVKGELDWC